jgi:hypothetical protein
VNVHTQSGVGVLVRQRVQAHTPARQRATATGQPKNKPTQDKITPPPSSSERSKEEEGGGGYTPTPTPTDTNRLEQT